MGMKVHLRYISCSSGMTMTKRCNAPLRISKSHTDLSWTARVALMLLVMGPALAATRSKSLDEVALKFHGLRGVLCCHLHLRVAPSMLNIRDHGPFSRRTAWHLELCSRDVHAIPSRRAPRTDEIPRFENTTLPHLPEIMPHSISSTSATAPSCSTFYEFTKQQQKHGVSLGFGVLN